MNRRPFGAEIRPTGEVRFRIWAPGASRMSVEIDGIDGLVDMAALADGWHEAVSARAGPGTRYRFVLPDGLRVPDPASRFQPDDVMGPSEVVDPGAFQWHDQAWRGRPWEDTVVYELHVGTFTPEGTFAAAAGRLGHLVDLGVTAMEIMPVADFPGARNWGYDGVLPFAPDSSYGRPEDLKALVDAAHEAGLMVFLDVVYNHFGPSGNFLSLYAPAFFSPTHHSPWGAAINFDGPGSPVVREYFVANALYWLDEFHLDGLRLDAVHAIVDDSPTHLLTEIADRIGAVDFGRPIHLVLENELNQARWLRREQHAPGYTAQWNDDVHHGLHVAATGESSGYYGRFSNRTDLLASALAEGFAGEGEDGVGKDGTVLPSTAFVAFTQNHDQIGNRAFGDRLTTIAPGEAIRATTAILLLSPQIPLLFMGEEWGATTPFPFFCDFDDELAALVKEGRRNEFAAFPEFSSEQSRARIPDPQSPATFATARLDWEECGRNEAYLSFYRALLDTRRRIIRPLLPQIRGTASGWRVHGHGAFEVSWQAGAETLLLQANLSAERAAIRPAPAPAFWVEGEAGEAGFAPWTVRWSLETAGHRALDGLLPA